jgi:hypothetical protein
MFKSFITASELIKRSNLYLINKKQLPPLQHEEEFR